MNVTQLDVDFSTVTPKTCQETSNSVQHVRCKKSSFTDEPRIGVNPMKRIALVLALGSMAALSAAQAAKTQKMTGYISDSKCGSMHMDNGIGCVKQCIENGNRPVFVDAQGKVWAIDNPDSVKNDYGYNVQVDVVVDISKKGFVVEKIKRTGGTMGGMKDGIPM